MWQKRKPWSDNNTCNFKIKNKQKLHKTTLIDYFNRGQNYWKLKQQIFSPSLQDLLNITSAP
jgi:hypothetical protein